MSTQRTITVYSTKTSSKTGSKTAKITTNAETWGELKSKVEEEGFNLSSLHAAESVNKHDLVHTDAKLPENDFTLFLRPKETKSGVTGYSDASYRDCKNKIKELIEEHGEHAREHFVTNHPSGKNYTQMGTTMLQEAITSYNSPVMEETVSDSDNVTSLSPVEKARQASKLLSSICEDTEEDLICESVGYINDEIDALMTNLSDDEPTSTEEEKLAKEAEDFFDGY